MNRDAEPTPSDGVPVLELRGLRRSFGRGAAQMMAVDGVDLTVSAGEVLLIMGPSGSGKTTLLTLAAGLLRPSSGTVQVGGKELTAMSDKVLAQFRRNKIGFIFQSFNLLSALSAVENVQVPLSLASSNRGNGERRSQQLLEEFDMGDRLHAKPDHLSGGERQRVSVARALANDPDIVFADEPTANLDSKRGHEVMELLRRVAKERGKTVVIVSHDNRIRDIADQVIWLEDGRIKDTLGIVHDPVCGMALDESTVAISSGYNGQSFHFCAPGCKRLFDEDPERYIGAGGSSGHGGHGSHHH